jgi:hypothetical protein
MTAVDTPIDLLPGEQLLWQGESVRHRLFWPPDAFLIPFSLFWCGFAVFWEAQVLRGDTPLLFPIFGGCFVAMGVYFVVGRFVARAISSRRTRYAVTDRRLVVTGGLTGRRTQSAYLKDLPPPILTERDDRSGTLAFGPMYAFGDLNRRRNGRVGSQIWSGAPSELPVLADIAEARYVRDLIANAQIRMTQPR